jgi:hypothetical protein
VLGEGGSQFYTDCDVRSCSTSNKMINSMRMWINIDPHLMLHIFLPALIFSDSFNLSIHMVSDKFRGDSRSYVPLNKACQSRGSRDFK